MRRHSRSVTPVLGAMFVLAAATMFAAPVRTAYVSDAARLAILRRAQVWIPPAQPPDRANLRVNPPGSFAETDVVSCRFAPTRVGGNTPKFDCRLDTGELLRIRYGEDNPEVYTQVAATRLMSAVGFPADRVYVVSRVRCFGCPDRPFEALGCLDDHPERHCFPRIDYTQFRDFDRVVMQRSLEGRRIESRRHHGWTWPELDRIDPAAGGAKRAEVDALRLMAVFLADWDTKADNQRLLCLGAPGDTARCRYPVAMVHDLGATFGPNKLDLDGWARAPIWSDAARCVVSMRTLPYGGSNFPDAKITEAGRLLLADRLRQLTGPQLRDLFEGARFQLYPRGTPASRDVATWIRVFGEKVRALADRPPCPE